MKDEAEELDLTTELDLTAIAKPIIIRQKDYSWGTGRPKILPRPENLRLSYTSVR